MDNEIVCEICNTKLIKYPYITKKSKRFYNYCKNCNLLSLDKAFYIDEKLEFERYKLHNNDSLNKQYVDYLVNIIERTFETVFNMKKSFIRDSFSFLTVPSLIPSLITSSQYYHFSNNFSILDYGCGNKPVLLEILNEKYHINKENMYFYDLFFYPEIKPFSRINNFNLNDLNLNDFNLNDFNLSQTNDSNFKKFDLIFCIEVVEHFSEILINFKKIFELLSQNGILVIHTNFFMENYLENIKDWWYISDITHKNFYSYETFKKISQIFKVKIVYSDKKNMIIFKKKKDN